MEEKNVIKLRVQLNPLACEWASLPSQPIRLTAHFDTATIPKDFFQMHSLLSNFTDLQTTIFN